MREIWNFGNKWYVLEEILRHISGSLREGSRVCLCANFTQLECYGT